MIRRGEIREGKTLVALLLELQRRRGLTATGGRRGRRRPWRRPPARGRRPLAGEA